MCAVVAGEDAGGLDHHVNAEIAPADLGRITLGQPLDLRAASDDAAVGDRHIDVQRAEDGVVLEQVREGVDVAKVVGGHDLDAGPAHRVHRTPEIPSDPAEPVDSYPDSHLLLP